MTGANHAETITVQLYQGARGHVLRIAVQSTDALKKFRAALYDLSQAKVRETNLSQLDFVVLFPPLKKVLLRVTDEPQEPSRTVKLEGNMEHSVLLVWTRHSEGWLESAEMLDALSEPGHQYLSRGTGDDAEIQVTFKE